MTESTELVIIDQQSINPVVLFTEPEKLDKTLADIKEKVMSFVPDTTTSKGRKDIASLAYKVAQSKTWLDNCGKNLVAEWKEKSKKVDECRKQARDFLDALKDEARSPLTAWEAAEEARLKAEALSAQIAADWEEEIKEDEVFNLKAEIARRDAENARIEAERIAKEQAEREEAERKQAEIDRIEREKRIAEEAKAKAEAEAKAAAEKAERDAAAKLEAERIASAKRIAEEQLRAKMEAEAAERKRLADIKAAEEKAEAEKQAIIQAQLEKERKEAARIEAERIANEKRVADLEHRKKINNAAKSSIMEFGFSCEEAEKIVSAIAKGRIDHVTINY